MNIKLEELNVKMVNAERARDFSKAADLKYGAIPELLSAIEKLKTGRRVGKKRED